MNQTFQKIISTLSQILHKRPNTLKTTLPRLWYGTSKTTSEEELKNILKKTFPEAKTIEVDDVSGGCGAMYNVYVETKEFQGKSIAKQHQTIYSALEEQIKQIHGIHVVTKVAQ